MRDGATLTTVMRAKLGRPAVLSVVPMEEQPRFLTPSASIPSFRSRGRSSRRIPKRTPRQATKTPRSEEIEVRSSALRSVTWCRWIFAARSGFLHIVARMSSTFLGMASNLSGHKTCHVAAQAMGDSENTRKTPCRKAR